MTDARAKDHRSPEYAALKSPTWAEYDAEKQRILKNHGREAMLAFAKAEQHDDYRAEMGESPPGWEKESAKRALLDELREYARPQRSSSDEPERKPKR